MKNIFLRDGKLTLLKNGRVHKRFVVGEITSIKLIAKRRKSWLIEFVLGVIGFIFFLGMLFKSYYFIVSMAESFNLFTLTLYLSMISLLVMMSFNGLISIRNKYHIRINDLDFEIDGYTETKWNDFLKEITSAGVSLE